MDMVPADKDQGGMGGGGGNVESFQEGMEGFMRHEI